ncbi:MAG: hypothetical protein H6672_05675 [Anaerolineaceae bacterium]|nr:hypothetical protein [Anaerolineaceae bacterium]
MTRLQSHYEDTPVNDTRSGYCESCGQEVEFTYLGAQRWPQRLVELTGVPPVTYLWVCGCCSTTTSIPKVDL